MHFARAFLITVVLLLMAFLPAVTSQNLSAINPQSAAPTSTGKATAKPAMPWLTKPSAFWPLVILMIFNITSAVWLCVFYVRKRRARGEGGAVEEIELNTMQPAEVDFNRIVW